MYARLQSYRTHQFKLVIWRCEALLNADHNTTGLIAGVFNLGFQGVER